MKKNLFFILLILVLVLGVFIYRGAFTGSPPESSDSPPIEVSQELYQLRNPYVGDASANSRILQALLPANETGPFHMELETVERPYVIRVIFEEAPDDPAWLDELMAQQGLLILALIDNSDTLEWAYPLDLDTEPKTSDIRLTREDLYAALDIVPEDFSLTPAVLEQLLAKSGTISVKSQD